MMYSIILMKNFALSIVMLIFSIWNWYLSVKGQTVIEFMSNREDANESTTFHLSSWKENLFVIFGTTSLVEMTLPVER